MTSIAKLLGDKAEGLLNFKTPKISKERLHLPGPDVVDRLFTISDRNNRVLKSSTYRESRAISGYGLPLHFASGSGH